MTKTSPWRLISFAIDDAFTNMAIDEAILESHLAGLVPPTLRLYGFSPSAMSIGRTQLLPQAVLRRAEHLGYDVVVRPTGGRAVLHDSDLTYSFVGRTETAQLVRASPGSRSSRHQDRDCGSWAAHPGTEDADNPEVVIQGNSGGFLSGSVSGAYRQICLGLMEGMRYLGLTLEMGSASVPYSRLHDCFQATTQGDLHYRGKKMIGSAQLRRRNGVLQHGSILLSQSQLAMAEILEGGDVPISLSAPAHAERHANLFEALGRTVSPLELQQALKAGFEIAFAIELVELPLSDGEMDLMRRLRATYQVR